MKLKHFLVVAFAFVSGMASAQQMPNLPIDPNVRIGKLDNGLTYYIRHNNWPENVANFYIAQRVGSIQEEESQRGLAHFLEHMAFNGSEHFPDSTLLEYTRSLGVEFGSDLNAYTGIDQTVYRICNVPTKRQTALDSCLLILKDWSNGLTLDDKEIDQERGVIHQEWQLNSSASMRIFERTLPKQYPGCRYGERLPIGLMSVVDNFKYNELRDYYHKWYHTGNQAIIVVGNVDVDHTEAEIKRLWKDVKKLENADPVVDVEVPDNDQPIYIFDKDKELQRSSVSIAMKHEPVDNKEKENALYLIDNYAKTMIAMMLNERFSEMTQKEDCPFFGAYSYDGQYIYSKTKDAFNLGGSAKEGKELEALAAMYREAQRVRQYGFTATEYDRTKAEYLSQLEAAYENRNKIKNDQLGDEYRDNFLDNEPIPGIEVEYQLMTQVIPMLSVDMINEYAKELITDNDTNLVVTLYEQEKEGKTYPTEQQMQQTINNVRTESIEAYKDNVKNEPLVDETKLPKAGKIVKEKEDKHFGYKELTLSNGARVILKKTDFKDNEIQFYATARGGMNLYGPADDINLKYFNQVMNTCGLGNFSNNELSKALLGKQAGVNLGLGNYNQVLSGWSVPKDIETMMQLLYLNFTAVSKDQDKYKATMASMAQALKNKHLSPESAFSDTLTTAIYNHNVRFSPMEESELALINYDRIMQIQKERFANAGQFTFYFIGNIDEATLRPLIEKYIACLPKGKAEKWVRKDFIAKGIINNCFKRESETPKAMASDFYHMPVDFNVENMVLADAAGQVLSMVYLKSIREDASAAYSVGAYGSVTLTGGTAFVQLFDQCPMDPNKSELAISLLEQGINDCAKQIDADKVEKVKANMLKNLDEEMKTNDYWTEVINNYLETGVDTYSGYRAAIEGLTPQKIAAFIQKILDAKNHIQVVMLPADK